MIDAPPSDAGGSKLTVADALPRTADTFSGALGTAAGVADTNADSGPAPTALDAWIVNEYPVPFVSPDTTQGDVAQVEVVAPGRRVTVYPVIADPPSPGAVNANDTWWSPAVADRALGIPGVVAGVAMDEPAGPLPAALVAITVNV